jgi:hypothetical protein
MGAGFQRENRASPMRPIIGTSRAHLSGSRSSPTPSKTQNAAAATAAESVRIHIRWREYSVTRPVVPIHRYVVIAPRMAKIPLVMAICVGSIIIFHCPNVKWTSNQKSPAFFAKQFLCP